MSKQIGIDCVSFEVAKLLKEKGFNEDYGGIVMSKNCKLVVLFILILFVVSCTFDEVPAGKSVVTSVRIIDKVKHNAKTCRTYKVVCKPLVEMDYLDVGGIFNNTSGFIIYTDSLVHVGDTIEILK